MRYWDIYLQLPNYRAYNLIYPLSAKFNPSVYSGTFLRAMSTLIDKYRQFEGWFNKKFAWFFTNGMKQAD